LTWLIVALNSKLSISIWLPEKCMTSAMSDN
jgi:hypothetical protein